MLENAVEIDGITYDLVPFGTVADTFITDGLDLGLAAGDEITGTYTDPTDSFDVATTDTITIGPSVLVTDSFYVGPIPFATEVTFGFGTGIATEMQVVIYDLAGKQVWDSTPLTDVTEITWDGAGLANGCYIYVVTATDGTNPFSESGKVFINR